MFNHCLNVSFFLNSVQLYIPQLNNVNNEAATDGRTL